MSSLVELNPDNEEFWEFGKWGEKVIAVCGHNNTPRIITLGDSVFADLTTSPPNARHIAVVGNFVVMGNIKEGGTVYPQRVRWSGINDETNWTTNKRLQSDYQDILGNYGGIQALRGGEYLVIFMEHFTQTMRYIGPPQVFSFDDDDALPGVGTPAPNSVVQVGDVCYLLSQNGFIAVQGGRQVLEIGANKINKWFYDNVKTEYINRVVGAWDQRERHIKWIFNGSVGISGGIKGVEAGVPNRGVIFDLETGKWSHFETQAEWIFQGLGEAFTLDQLDNITTSIDALTTSLDSNQWISNDPTIIAFNAEHKSGSFDGTAMDAIIDTNEGGAELGRSLITRARLEVTQSPITIAPGEATVTPAARNSQTEKMQFVFGTDISPAPDGSYPMRSEGRYHRLRVEITGGFELAQGVSVEETARTGNR